MEVTDDDADREQGEDEQDEESSRKPTEPSFQLARQANLLILHSWQDVPSVTKARVATHYRYKRGRNAEWAEDGKFFPLWNAQTRDDYPRAKKGRNRVIFYKKLTDDSYQSVPVQAAGGSPLDVYVEFEEPEAKQKSGSDAGGIAPLTAQWAPSQIQELIGALVEGIVKTTKLARAPIKMVLGQVAKEEKRTKRERDLRLGLRKRHMDLLARSGGVYNALGDHIRENPEIVNAMLMEVGSKALRSLIPGDDERSKKSMGRLKREADEEQETSRPARAATVAAGVPIKTKPRTSERDARVADDRPVRSPSDTRPRAAEAVEDSNVIPVPVAQSTSANSPVSARTPVPPANESEAETHQTQPSEATKSTDLPPS